MKNDFEIWLNEEPNTISIRLKQPFLESLNICLGIILGKKLVFKARKTNWHIIKKPKEVKK